MDISTLSLARAQFVASLSFLALFLAVSLALVWVLLFFKIRARWSGRGGWTAAYRFWVRIFALAFVLTLAASVPVLIQIGSLWAGLMDKIGNVAGPLLGYGILSVFILKSCFLGVMLFGQRRVSDGAHTLAVLMVALGQLVAVFWVLALQSWMQTPDGAVLVDGRYQVYDWVAVVLNPSVGWRMAMVIVGSALAASFLDDGRDRAAGAAAPAGRLASATRSRPRWSFAVVAAFLQVPVATGAGQLVAKLQPAKAAAAAGFWQSGAVPQLVLFGLAGCARPHERGRPHPEQCRRHVAASQSGRQLPGAGQVFGHASAGGADLLGRCEWRRGWGLLMLGGGVRDLPVDVPARPGPIDFAALVATGAVRHDVLRRHRRRGRLVGVHHRPAALRRERHHHAVRSPGHGGFKHRPLRPDRLWPAVRAAAGGVFPACFSMRRAMASCQCANWVVGGTP